MPTTVERCGSASDLLHRVVAEHLDDFLAQVQADGQRLPPWVEREFRRYQVCGDLNEGFAHLHCEDCDVHRIVPFSCKTRGFCPSCMGRRMAEKAAHWVDGVFAHVPIRQWTLTLPWRRRFLMARHHDLCRRALSLFLDTLNRWMRQSLDLPEGRGGSITVIQFFSSSLATDPHYHALVLDGLFARVEQTGELRFHPLLDVSTEDVEQVVLQAAERIEKWLARRGFGPDAEGQEELLDDAHADLQARSLSPYSLRRYQVLGGRRVDLPPRCAICEGYNLHAGQSAEDRESIERMARYVLRPPLARERLERREDGMLVMRLKKPWADGSASFLFTPVEFLGRLSAIIPPPNINTIIYSGVLAGRSAWRAEVVPPPPAREKPGFLHKEGIPEPKRRWWVCSWAELLYRVFLSEGLECPRCGKKMRLRAIVMPPATIRVRDGLNRAAARAPPDLAEAKATA